MKFTKLDFVHYGFCSASVLHNAQSSEVNPIVKTGKGEMVESLDRIEELLEQLHQAVQDCPHISDENEEKVTDFANWLHHVVYITRQGLDSEQGNRWPR